MFDKDVTTFRIAAVSRQGFCRCGACFTYDGEVVGVASFTEEQWAAIVAEPNLRVTPAEEIPETEAEARFDVIWGAIQTLPADGFQKNGKPRLEDLNAVLADDIDGPIDAGERDAIWDQMVGDGFTAPQAADP